MPAQHPFLAIFLTTEFSPCLGTGLCLS